MLSNNLNVSFIQADIAWENVFRNLACYQVMLRSIAKNTDVLVLPELFATGFTMNVKTCATSTEQSESLRFMIITARQLDILVIGSVIICENDLYYNRLFAVFPNGSYQIYNKRHLFGLANEHQHFTAGNANEQLTVDYKHWRLRLVVCYDLRFPVWCRNHKTNPYDVLVVIANWPERRAFAWQQLLTARAIENQAYTLGVNRVGSDGNGIYHSGNSMLIDATGGVKVELIDQEGIVNIGLSAKHLKETRDSLPFLNDGDGFEITS